MNFRKVMLLITLSALIMISAVHPTSQSLAYDSSASFPEHKKLRNVLDQINLTIEIDLIGYSEEMIDTDYLETMLDQSFYLSAPTGGFVTLKLNLEFNFLDPTVAELMETYIQSAGTQGSGVAYSLNTTLLTDDLATGQRRNIFIPEDGITLNVEDLEEYISTNLYAQEQHAVPGYTFYLLNLSSLDDPETNADHYYLKRYVSADTNRTVDFWYSGYNNVPPSQPLGWGGNERFCFIDLSARTWYLDWVKTAWPNLGSISPIYFDYPDIDTLVRENDISTQDGRNTLHLYLAQWINSYLGNVFSAYYFALPVGKTYSLQTVVFNNLTDAGYKLEDLNWVISASRIRKQLEKDLPWIKWDIEVRYVNLSDYSSIYNYIQNNLEVDQNGPYLEVAYGFLDLLESKLDDFFNLSAADTVLPCYAFLTDNVAFKYTGISFAGLGGMGWELLVGDQYSLFEDSDVNRPRRGMSATLIHELGHSLGMPHPHSFTYSWGSEFIAEIMSYFPLGEMQFSVFYRDGIGRPHAYYWYDEAIKAYNNAVEFYDTQTHTSEYDQRLTDISNKLQQCPLLYQQMDYNASIITAQEVIAEASQFIQDLEKPVSTTPQGETTKSGLSFLDLMLISLTLVVLTPIIRKLQKKATAKK
ncbi:MAG: hypothetical protein ACTSYN_04890 [Candidatus Heimdallarchaeaceae archaeon]